MLIKLNAFGNTEWSKEYGRPDFNDEGVVVKQTKDGGYILGVTTSACIDDEDDLFNFTDVRLIKTNSVGTIDWLNDFGGEFSDKIFDVVERDMGGYIFIGTAQNTDSFTDDIFLVKTDAGGVELDSHMFGNSGKVNGGNSIEKLPNGDYLISGFVGGAEEESQNIFLSKIGGGVDDIHAVGFQLSYSSPNGIGHQFSNSATYSRDGSYILTGAVETTTNGFDQVLIKVNTQGVVLWEKVFGGTEDDEGLAVIYTQNPGYVFVGNSSSGTNSVITVTKVNIDGNLK